MYFGEGQKSISVELFLLETSTCVGRWATAYEAYVLGDAERCGGSLPEVKERDLLFRRLTSWLLRRAPNPSLAVLSLSRHQALLWDQHDGIPGMLWLSKREFVQLRRRWKEAGLPDDIYYPVHKQHMVIEPTEQFNTIVRARRTYSPRQWAVRESKRIESLDVPDEQMRLQDLIQGCDQFRKVLLRRLLELSEPGRPPDEREVDAIGRMLRTLGDLEGRASRALRSKEL